MVYLALASFTATLIVVAAAPGPGVFAAVATAMATGFRSAVAIIAGIVSGHMVFLVLAQLGMSFAAKALGNLFYWVKLFGGLYLIWIGIRIFLSTPTARIQDSGCPVDSYVGNWCKGVFVTFSNPKAILFFSPIKMIQGVNMSGFHISFMEQNDIPKSAEVLSIAMLNNPHHLGIFLGNGENERLEIENMFLELFNHLPGIVFLAKENEKIIGVMRMKSCIGKNIDKPDILEDENDINWRKFVWFKEWAVHDPVEQHWHLGPIGVLPSYRGRGVGTELMRRFCTEVDNCSATAYLETDLDENVRFYEKFGFRVVSKSDIFDVENRYMLRDSIT